MKIVVLKKTCDRCQRSVINLHIVVAPYGHHTNLIEGLEEGDRVIVRDALQGCLQVISIHGNVARDRAVSLDQQVQLLSQIGNDLFRNMFVIAENIDEAFVMQTS